MNAYQISAGLTFGVLGVVTLFWLMRRGEAHSAAEKRIVDEGGEVLSRGSIGMLVSDPFSHATSDAAGHFFKVRYAERSGTWFVRTSSKRPEGEWLWVDDAGASSLPVTRGDDSRVVPRVRRIPHWLAAAIVLGILACFTSAGALAGKYGH